MVVDGRDDVKDGRGRAVLQAARIRLFVRKRVGVVEGRHERRPGQAVFASGQTSDIADLLDDGSGKGGIEERHNGIKVDDFLIARFLPDDDD